MKMIAAPLALAAVLLVCAALALAVPAAASAQHVHPSPAAEPSASPAPASPTLFQSEMAPMAGMTADAAPHGPGPGWSFMTMGLARLQYNRQGGPSGDTALESSNWSMAMAQRPWPQGTLTLMMMNSLEPATFRGGGMPQIFQTGETYQGRPLVDRQHPHDLFMSLSATWRRPAGEGRAFWLQVAPVGEPALGPTAFMHRASSGENPAAPLGHHWHDSSHITRTVVTVGAAWRRVVLEGSAFHGAEPDEGRWDIDGGSPDSVSGRVRVRLGGGWSGQVSHGFLKQPEALSLGDLRRTTASLHYGAEGNGPLAVSLIWGRNREIHGMIDAALAEAAWQLTARDQLYGRAEYAEKESELLINKGISEQDQHGHEHGFAAVLRPSVPVGAMTFGYLRNMDLFRSVNAGLGADLTVYQFGATLRSTYGDMPVSTHVFLRLRWGKPHGAHAAAGEGRGEGHEHH